MGASGADDAEDLENWNKRTNDGDWYYNYNRFAYDIFYILGYIWKIKGLTDNQKERK